MKISHSINQLINDGNTEEFKNIYDSNSSILVGTNVVFQ
jgi:hypothetical protein